MEKYYFARLNNNISAASKRPVKLIEIQYSRRPPSFGAVYLGSENGGNGQTCDGVKQFLYMDKLQVENGAKFISSNRVELVEAEDRQIGRVVDFDVRKSIILDGNPSAESPQVVVLCADGGLFSVQLINGSVKRLASTREQSSLRSLALSESSGNFLQCKLLHAPSENFPSEAEVCQIFALAERQYFAFKIKDSKLELTHSYSVSTSGHIVGGASKFRGLFEINEQLVVLEMDDLSLKIIHRSECLSTVTRPKGTESARSDQYLTLSSSKSGATFIVASQTQLVAYCVQVSMEQNLAEVEDPDQLLPKEPDFELEQCWSLDLTTLDCVRSLEAETEDDASMQQLCCLCSLWSSDQSSTIDPARYLLIAYKHHILVYDFQQKQTLPFSVVYDSSFLELIPLEIEDETSQSIGKSAASTSNNFYVDVKMEPTLVQNFKLIGAQASDALFNSLFLAKRMQFNQMQYFPQLALLVAVSSLHSLIVFKITNSSNINCQKDNVYQQLVTDAIRGAPLLKEEIARLERENESLRDVVSRLEGSSVMDMGRFANNLDHMLQIDLKRRQDIGALYDLTISLSNLIQVDGILVAAKVQAHFLEPSGAKKLQSADYNDDGSGVSLCDKEYRAYLVAVEDISDPDVLNSLIGEKDTDHREELIQGHVILKPDDTAQTGCSLVTLPVFIPDGQMGFMDVYFIINNSSDPLQLKSVLKHITHTQDEQFEATLKKYHKRSVQVKPLMSYEVITLASTSKRPRSCLNFSGDFTRGQAFEWLSQYLYLPGKATSFSLTSVLTQCSIDCIISADGQLMISSDDVSGLELIKRQILKQATDQSIKLDIEHSKLTMADLRQTLSRQLDMFLKGVADFENPATEADSGPDSAINLLLEILLADNNFADLPPDYAPKDDLKFETSIRDSIKSVMTSAIKDSGEGGAPRANNTNRIYCRLIATQIANFLLDHDRSEGLMGSSLALRKNLAEAAMGLLLSSKGESSSRLVDKIFGEWSKIKPV